MAKIKAYVTLFVIIIFASIVIADIIQNLSANQVSTEGIKTNTLTEGNCTHVSISNTVPFNSLVSYWNFECDAQNSTGFTAYDFSTNSYDGIGVNDSVVNSTNCLYSD